MLGDLSGLSDDYLERVVRAPDGIGQQETTFNVNTNVGNGGRGPFTFRIRSLASYNDPNAPVGDWVSFPGSFSREICCPSSSSSSSSSSGGDPEYTCANNCEPSIAQIWPPVDPGHYETPQECQTACAGCTFAPNATAYCATGDEWTSASGTFSPAGTYDGVPYYLKLYGGGSTGYHLHRYGGNYWYIRFTDNVASFSGPPEAGVASTSTAPPLTGWSNGGVLVPNAVSACSNCVGCECYYAWDAGAQVWNYMSSGGQSGSNCYCEDGNFFNGSEAAPKRTGVENEIAATPCVSFFASCPSN